MAGRRFSLFAIISLAAALLAPAVAFAARVIDVGLRLVAAPFVWLSSFDGRSAFARPALAYDGPPVHDLRHEAGVSRRSAARHV